MANQASQSPVPSHPLRWFPEFWELSRRRLRPQARLLGLSLVVGIISGLGAIVFPGVRIGRGAVVSAGAVVDVDVPANVLVAGNPATVVRELPP